MKIKPASVFKVVEFIPDNAAISSTMNFVRIKRDFENIFESNKQKFGSIDNEQNTKLIIDNAKLLTVKKGV